MSRFAGENGKRTDWKAQILEIAKEKLLDSTHSFDHANRVWQYCKKISEKEGGDEDILFAASFLHDITYSVDYKGHEKSGADEAEKILKQIGFPKKKIALTIACIRNHRLSKTISAVTIEEEIIQDADKLDAMGAWGIARCFLWTGKNDLDVSSAIGHFDDKLLKLKNLMQTEEGKRFAAKRHEYMMQFIEELREI
jgi:uncharacterized protein